MPKMTRIVPTAALILAAASLSACGDGTTRLAEENCLAIAGLLTDSRGLKVEGMNSQEFRGALAIFIRFDHRGGDGMVKEEVLRCDFRKADGGIRLTGLKRNAEPLPDAQVAEAAAFLASGVTR